VGGRGRSISGVSIRNQEKVAQKKCLVNTKEGRIWSVTNWSHVSTPRQNPGLVIPNS